MNTYEVSPYSLERAIEQDLPVLKRLAGDATWLKSDGPEANLILDVGDYALRLWYPDGTACQPPAQTGQCGKCGEFWCGFRNVTKVRTGDDQQDLETLWDHTHGVLSNLRGLIGRQLQKQLDKAIQAMQTLSLSDVWEIASESVDVHDAATDLALECGIMPLMSWNDVIPGVYPDPSGRLVSWTYHPVYNDVIEVWA